MKQGKVLKWIEHKGFGFIRDGENSYLLHHTHKPRDYFPEHGDIVEFEPAESLKRLGSLEAHTVRLVKAAANG